MLTKQNLLIGGGVVALIVVVIFAWMFGDMIRDSITAWSKGKASQELQDAKADAARSKAIAEEAIATLNEANEKLSKQIEVTKEAEKRFFESGKISEAVKNDYENKKNQYLNNDFRSTNPALNTNELCERARQLNIHCE